jgi:DNA-directed RNA polymerase subunit beta
MPFPSVKAQNGGPLEKFHSYAHIPVVLDVPNLIQVQLSSFEWFTTTGLRELFDEISPIQDITGSRFELHFLGHEFHSPKYSADECRRREITFAAPLYVTVRLVVKKTGEIKEQKLYMGDVPSMTSNGTFLINGAERVVVSQLVRSPGAYFTITKDPSTDRSLCLAKLIPYRGAWLEFETSMKDVISVKVDRKRKLPVTTLLRTLGYTSEKDILAEFRGLDGANGRSYIRTTLEREGSVRDTGEALLEFYRRLRPGEPPSLENARNLLDNLFFNPRRYDLGPVGRYKINRRLGLSADAQSRTLSAEDIVAIIRMMIRINNGEDAADDIDHLGNRRVRAVGELIQNQLRVGLLRMERVIKERMTIIDPDLATPSALVNVRPLVAAVREFFGGSQLSQFMDQTNPLAELTHKRRLSALGPGGLSRERAGFDVRDVHHSHYGRICPIETPEGPNIGLLGSMATYARINSFGFIETPYRRVFKDLPSTSSDLLSRTLSEDVTDSKRKLVGKSGQEVTPEMLVRFSRLKKRPIPVRPFVSADPDEVLYMSADEEELHIIAQANCPLDGKNQFTSDRIEVRKGERIALEPPELIEYMDVAPMQIVSVSTALIPFLEHDDANRALMGSNMQRQAVPLLKPESPLVGTGMERRVAHDSGQVVLSRSDGVVASVTGTNVTVVDSEGKEENYSLTKFLRSNQGTCITQRPIVFKGDVVSNGQPLADSSSTDQGDLALGQNVLVAFMSWDGYNYEDAVIVSENLIRNDKFTSVHIEKYEVEARDTKLGPEEITRDMPNVGEEALRDLDENGIIRIGAEVGPGDVLVGKITPKGETELTAEEKLLRAIFGEKARDVKDTSLRVPHGERGKVKDVKVTTRASKDELSHGVNMMVRVWIAQTRKLSEGDKMAGRHGNKGVISTIMPAEDMPYLPDGTPVDIILNPIGVPSRMNLGQMLETHLGLAAANLHFKVITPVFDGARDVNVDDALSRVWLCDKAGAFAQGAAAISGGPPDLSKAHKWVSDHGFDPAKVFSDNHPGEARRAALKLWFREMGIDTKRMSSEQMTERALRTGNSLGVAPPIFGKTLLYDGRTGEPFDEPVTVGQIYMMKLIHLVEDKIHARSTGPYSLITQQPLGGKAQFGGQRFGEMEVWALEAYSAAHNLQEMLTVKSDDVVGRVKTYEAIVKGEDIIQPGVPESFHVLVKELQSLGLAVELRHEEEKALPGAFVDDDGLESLELGMLETGYEEEQEIELDQENQKPLSDTLVSHNNAADSDDSEGTKDSFSEVESSSTKEDGDVEGVQGVEDAKDGRRV